MLIEYFCTERGQGLNNAIKDASDIVDAIKAATAGETTQREAITTYEAEMKPRGAKEVELSLEQALKARDANTIKDSPLFKHGWQRGKPEAPAQVQAQAT
jgi:2-polyprenyl-6-methoxyphenol hydroxylase-like FAD-dependent oxidoreductase